MSDAALREKVQIAKLALSAFEDRNDAVLA
eukprot:COSAG04_NODE_2688_length_3736_cov_17.142700_1_plen_29_part_10